MKTTSNSGVPPGLGLKTTALVFWPQSPFVSNVVTQNNEPAGRTCKAKLTHLLQADISLCIYKTPFSLNSDLRWGNILHLPPQF